MQPTSAISLVPHPGPDKPPSSAARRGLYEGPAVQRWSAPERENPGEARLGSIVVEAGRRIEVAVYPRYDGNFAACDAWFALVDDAGRRLPALDQYGHRYQLCDRSTPWLVVDQWNLVAIDTSEHAPGSQVELLLTLPGGAAAEGWVQVLGQHPLPTVPEDVVDLVRTSRGSHSRPGQSRGNTYPMACLPHGFNFISPITDARAGNWIFTWHPDGGTRLQALAFCHAPSPWIGDRANIQLMPFTGEPQVDPARRSRGFDPRRMVDSAHHFAVDLDDGTHAEVAPTDHAAVFRFTFTRQGRRGTIIDLAKHGETTVRLRPDGRAEISGRVDPEAEWNRRELAPTAWFFGITRQPVRILETGLRRLLRRPARRPEAAVLELVDGDVLEVAMATSFISSEQARHNLELEVGDARFDEVERRAHRAWADLLGRLHIEGANHDQLVHAYSNLARLHAWPNSMHENQGRPDEPRWVHASPFAEQSRLVDGQIMINNGYWDTYRTCWPAYNLFTPDLAPQLTDGLLAAWRESGWMGRWSAPGHVDCMVGTSSDVIFADASRHGIDFDEVTAYDSMLRNACCPSPDPTVGRKGIGRGRFTGVVGKGTGEGFSWSVENAICDATAALWSARLLDRCDGLGIPQRRDELAANVEWFSRRARATRQLFDPAVGFARGFPFGPADEFDPRDWGGDFTETNAWGMSVSTVQDGLSLAERHGGPAGLGEHLDRLFATPEGADHPGGYGQVIHEMVEARALRLGQCGLSNQPAHHIPFMYLFTDRPWRLHEVLADALDRLFVGNEIGQGYPGDEDNGEMSAWWLFCAMGLYPLLPGSGEFVLTCPAFSSRFERPEGALTITAHGEGAFIERARVNGREHHSLVVGVDELHGEAHVEVWRTDRATDFGLGHLPWSLEPDEPWRPDLASRAGVVLVREGAEHRAENVVDDRGETTTLVRPDDELVLAWPEAVDLRMLTLTLAEPGPVAVSVTVDDAPHELGGREVRWPSQTLAWQLPNGTQTSELRLRIAGAGAVGVQQVECW